MFGVPKVSGIEGENFIINRKFHQCNEEETKVGQITSDTRNNTLFNIMFGYSKDK